MSYKKIQERAMWKFKRIDRYG